MSRLRRFLLWSVAIAIMALIGSIVGAALALAYTEGSKSPSSSHRSSAPEKPLLFQPAESPLEDAAFYDPPPLEEQPSEDLARSNAETPVETDDSSPDEEWVDPLCISDPLVPVAPTPIAQAVR